MAVRVLYFAALRERVGVSEETVEVSEGARVADLVEMLEARHDALRGLTGYRVAVNQAFAEVDQVLPRDAEVALIPPVAGGAPEAPRLFVEVTAEALSADALTAHVADPRAGAQAVFLGVVRDNHRGRAVARMDYEAYEAMAAAELERLGERLLVAHPEALKVALVHRFGRLEIGEASVGVAVSSAHRGASFEACQWGIDAIKESVPIWKKEHYVEGDHHWVRADEMGARETSGDPDTPPAA